MVFPRLHASAYSLTYTYTRTQKKYNKNRKRKYLFSNIAHYTYYRMPQTDMCYFLPLPLLIRIHIHIHTRILCYIITTYLITSIHYTHINRRAMFTQYVKSKGKIAIHPSVKYQSLIPSYNISNNFLFY